MTLTMTNTISSLGRKVWASSLTSSSHDVSSSPGNVSSHSVAASTTATVTAAVTPTTLPSTPMTPTTFSPKHIVDAVNKTIQSIVTTTTTTTNTASSTVHGNHVNDSVLTTTVRPSTSTNTTVFHGDSHLEDHVPGDTHYGIPDGHEHHYLNFLAHSFIFQSVLVITLIVVLMGVIYILRKKQLDALRHHLMPIYNFDPSDDGEDWETELLDDQMVHQPINSDPTPGPNGQLKLDTGLTRGLKIQNNNSSLGSGGPGVSTGLLGMSPTPASGLLSSSTDSQGSQGRRLYTHERNPVV